MLPAFRKLAVAALLLAGLGFCAVFSAAQSTSLDVLTLYRELRTVGLDERQVYHIREATLDREDLHLYFSDGTIAFTRTVDGHITGAYFEGEGQVLLRPPNAGERASLGVFTGLGILDEQFRVAYLRFNDDTPQQLSPFLRNAPDDAADFVRLHNQQAIDFARLDGLRLLLSMTSQFPVGTDRLLHCNMLGRLGAFSVSYDALAEDQLVAAQVTGEGDKLHYDLWMAFPARHARAQPASERLIDPWRGNASVYTNLTRIDAQLLPPEELRATAELELSVHDGGQRLLVFELSRWLKVEQVTMNGQPLTVLQNEAIESRALAQLGNDFVTVALPRTLHAGEQIKLRFTYRGNVMQQAAPGLVWVGARGTWYPNRGMEMSRFDMSFRWPADWTLVATGHRTAYTASATEKSGTWVSESVIPFAGFNIGRYEQATASTGPVEVNAYASGTFEAALAKAAPNQHKEGAANLVEDAQRRAARIAQRQAQTIHDYEQWFGAFPFRSVSYTQLPGAISQGWPGMVFLSSLAFLTDAEKERLGMEEFERISTGDFMADHETAHQWWGDLVSWQSYRDQWMMESLSNYSAWLLLERQSPQRARFILDEYRGILASNNAAGRRQTDAGPVTLGLRLESSRYPNGYVNIAYGRGTWLLHMLRHMFHDASLAANEQDPDARFFSALRTFRQRYEHRAADTRQFQQVFEEFLPDTLYYEGRKSLDWFFQGWVAGAAMPKLKISNLRLTRAARTTASFVIEQQKAPRDLVTSVPVYAQLPGGALQFVARVFADGPTTRLRLTVPTGTQKLVLDPYSTILTEP